MNFNVKSRAAMTLHASVLALSCCVAAPTLAQAGNPAADAPETPSDIIVTAERRAVSVQDMPVSVVALSGETLDKRGIATLENLQYSVPSMTFSDVGNVKFLNIRGVGLSEGAPNQTTGVAVHLDGGYIAREFVYGDAFFDVATVEVLRGPQGTYLGQNASGGAIFINSKKPKLGETAGFVNAEYGSYDHWRVGAGIDIPLASWLSARISGEFESRDSYYKNHGPLPTTPASQVESQPGNLSRYLGRFQLLAEPTDKLEIRLIHQTSQNDTDGSTFKRYPFGSTTLPSTGLRDLNYDVPTFINVSYDRSTASVDWDATDLFRVHAVGTYQTTRQHLMADTDQGSPVTSPGVIQGTNDFLVTDRYYTGELNLISNGDGPFEWTVGATLLNFKQNNTLNFTEYNNPAGYPGTVNDPIAAASLFLKLISIRENQAVFGEVGYKLTPTLQIKIGGRYNHDKVGFGSGSYLGFSNNAPSGIPLTPPTLKFNTFTGRALVNWQPNDANLFYATLSKGYKPGGTTPFGANYKGEAVINKEIGWKGDLFDKLLQASVSVYHMAYQNFQRTYSEDPANPNPATATTKNVTGTTVRGVEAQLSGQISGFAWDASASYNKGKYGDLALVVPIGAVDGVNPTAPQTINVRGRSIDYLPEFAANVGISYAFELGAGTLTPSARLSYQGKYFTSFFQQAYDLVPAKTLVDLSIAYAAEANWRLEGYVRNVTDNTYIAASVGAATAPGSYIIGAPREFGVKLGYTF